MLYTELEPTFRGKDQILVRTFKNNKTGSETKIEHIYTHDKTGTKWFGFVDLYTVPIMRTIMAKNISDLYSIGLTLKDIKDWCNEEKALLRSSDPEKYEKLYSLVLQKETLATFTADPIKQNLALCTVYVIAEDERIDYFDQSIADQKMKLWGTDMDMTAFFLNWHTGHIRNSIKTLNKISTTVSKLERKGLL